MCGYGTERTSPVVSMIHYDQKRLLQRHPSGRELRSETYERVTPLAEISASLQCLQRRVGQKGEAPPSIATNALGKVNIQSFHHHWVGK